MIMALNQILLLTYSLQSDDVLSKMSDCLNGTSNSTITKNAV